MPEHNALVLEIFRQGEMLKMGISRYTELAPTLRHYSEARVSFTEVDTLCQEVISILNKADSKALRKTGQLLWEQLLTKSIKEALRSEQSLDLILSIDEELINIPWELLYDGSNFLCLNFNLGRVVRTKEELSHPHYRSSPSTLKMLILANPTNDLRASYLEGVFIKNQFDRRRRELSIDFKSTNIDTLYIKKNLRDYDIVHFAGHCEYDADNPKNSGWVFYDGRFTPRDILSMGSTAALPTLIFSNGCYSAKGVSDLIDSGYQGNNYSLACAFLFSGVRHYIGSIRKIEDPVSLVFSKEFYLQLISGRAVGESLRLSRLKLIKEYGITSIYWTSYLLYGDPNFALFRAKEKPAKTKLKRRALHRKTIALFSLTVVIISLGIYLWTSLPSLNPNSYLLFLRTQRLFQNGKNQEVILEGSRIIKNNPAFLAVYPLLAVTYQRIGDRENALKYYFAYLRYSEQRRDKKNLASAYIALGWFYHLEGGAQKAFDFYDKAVSVARETRDRLNEAKALRKLAVWHIDKDDYDRALELLTKSSELNRERQAIYEHRYNLACDYFDLGLVFANKNDFVTAKEFYKKSETLFVQLKTKNELSDYYFNLGEICLFEKQYQKAQDYYLLGLKLDEAQGNKMNLASDFNMLGELYVEMDNLNKAEDYFNRAVIISEQVNAQPELAGAYYNLGLLYKKWGKKNRAREYLRKAQEIYGRIGSPGYQEVKNELLSLDE